WRASVGVRSSVVTPRNADTTLPVAINWPIDRFAALIGTANPTPSAPPDSLLICALIPITRPRASKRGPQELPCVIGASVWIESTSLYDEFGELIDRWIAETTPTVIESSLPNGLPSAATGSPGRTREDSPSGTVTRACAAGSTFRSATSAY